MKEDTVLPKGVIILARPARFEPTTPASPIQRYVAGL